ncbi:general stress protein [Carnobacterium sp. CS13]|uniref:general stress protein n=1 Tax=Carnobacterium sp. CS13 TaxID=2800128 RepID=UPI001913353D|nr:general stress protein [Carnobacterium sp. CS13]QQP69390.1 general stress protein [Carnobacterium sp. CS13]
MTKVVESSYQTVDETIGAVERLLSEGRLVSDIVIVTSRENQSNIRNRTLVEVDRVPADGNKTAWEKFKEMFTDVDETAALEHYGIDKQTALRYNDAIKMGNYVILVEEKKDIPTRHNLDDQPVDLSEAFAKVEQEKPIGQAGSGKKTVVNTTSPRGESAYYNDQDSRLGEQMSTADEAKTFSGKNNQPSDSSGGFSRARQGTPIGQGGSGTRIVKNSSYPAGESAHYNDSDTQLSKRTKEDDDKLFSLEEDEISAEKPTTVVEEPVSSTTETTMPVTNLAADPSYREGVVDTVVPEITKENKQIDETAQENKKTGSKTKPHEQDETIKANNKTLKQEYDPADNPLQGRPKDSTDFETENARETAVEDSESLPRFDSGTITGQPFVDPLRDDFKK